MIYTCEWVCIKFCFDNFKFFDITK